MKMEKWNKQKYFEKMIQQIINCITQHVYFGVYINVGIHTNDQENKLVSEYEQNTILYSVK